ncbi:hypothetical protein [Devosia sp. Root685]|uniref:hypothetical protein n=1 Tax=Devosia sp. Root685 TaxID=1736587 RepID=UPI00138EEBFC|nr:hypothetical protein [Devosia sp. Root685]
MLDAGVKGVHVDVDDFSNGHDLVLMILDLCGNPASGCQQSSPEFPAAFSLPHPRHLLGNVRLSRSLQYDELIRWNWNCSSPMGAGELRPLTCVTQGKIWVIPSADRAPKPARQKVASAVEIKLPTQVGGQHF